MQTNETDQWSSQSSEAESECIIVPREGHDSIVEVGIWKLRLRWERTPAGGRIRLIGRVKVRPDQTKES